MGKDASEDEDAPAVKVKKTNWKKQERESNMMFIVLHHDTVRDGTRKRKKI